MSKNLRKAQTRSPRRPSVLYVSMCRTVIDPTILVVIFESQRHRIVYSNHSKSSVCLTLRTIYGKDTLAVSVSQLSQNDVTRRGQPTSPAAAFSLAKAAALTSSGNSGSAPITVRSITAEVRGVSAKDSSASTSFCSAPLIAVSSPEAPPPASERGDVTAAPRTPAACAPSADLCACARGQARPRGSCQARRRGGARLGTFRHLDLHEDGGGDASWPAACLAGLLGGLLQHVLQPGHVLRVLHRDLEIGLALAEGGRPRSSQGRWGLRAKCE